MMKTKKIRIIVILGISCFLRFNNFQILAVTYGSDTAVSIVNPFNIPSGTNNIFKTFACAKNGFGFADLNTTCSWQSMYPVSGPIYLKGGTLYLQSDLTLANTGSFVDLGSIKAQNHMITLSENAKTFASNSNPTGKLVLNLVARSTLTRAADSFDWSYDGKYLAVSSTGGRGNEFNIYEFTGSSLILRAGVAISGNPDVNSIRWHPNSYYLALATSNGFVRSYKFTPPSTITNGGTASFSVPYAVAFQKRGNYVAVGGTASTINIYSYSLSGGGSFSLVSTSTNSLGGSVVYDCLTWAPTGNKDDLIAGTYNGSTSGNLHLYNFTGSSLNHLKAYTQSKGVYALDWASTSTYVAAGFSDGTIRTYEHDASLNAIEQKQSYTIAGEVYSLSWKSNASELAAARSSSATNEMQIYSFNTGTYELTEKYPIALTTSAYCIRYFNSYIARSDYSTKYLSVYKENYSPFVFQDTKLYLNSNLTLGAPLTFTGNNVINGRGNKITFTGDGSINIAPFSNLEIQLTNLEFQKPNAFSLQGGTSGLALRCSNIELSNDVILGDGQFEIFDDLTITGPHIFQYNSEYTSTIHANSTLTFDNNAEFKIGKTRATTIEPLYFENASSQLNFNNATLHTTDSGLSLQKGIINISGNSIFDIDWTDSSISSTMQGLVFGDGENVSNDPTLVLQGNGTRLTVLNGAIVVDSAATPSMIQFYGQSQLAMNTTATIYIKKPLSLTSGWILSDSSSRLVIDSNAYLTFENTRVSPFDLSADQIVTGTVANYFTTVLDKNDSYNLLSGPTIQFIEVIQDGNIVTGIGTLTGSLIFQSNQSQLTWNSPQILNVGDVDLNGGKIIFSQNSGLPLNYTFINSGTVDLMGTTFNLGTQSTDWTSNIYWIGDGAELKLNKDVTLSGIWTFSGDVIVNGNEQSIYFGDNGKIILERGAHVTFKDILLGDMSTEHGIICSDDNCQITLDYTDISLAGDYLFNKGSIFVYNDSLTKAAGDLDVRYTFSYESTQTSTIDLFCALTIGDRTEFSIGRQDSAITNTNAQPIVFADATSNLILDGGTLRVTSSGMILTKGVLKTYNSSALKIDNSQADFALTLGNGLLEDDFEMDISAGANLSLKTGKLFYNNYLDNRIIFGSPESTMQVESDKGITTKRNLTLALGTLAKPLPTNLIIDSYPNTYLIYKNLHQYDYAHTQDFYLTGTVKNLTNPTAILDSDDKLLLNPGNLNRDIQIKQFGNIIQGSGNISGNIYFTDQRSSLTWDMPQQYSGGDIDLKGGRIIYTQDSGIGPQYSFKGSGTIDLTTKTIELGTAPTTWTGNFLWVGDGGIIRLNNDITLDGIWTLSGNITIEGNGYSMDLGTTSSIILERGTQLILNNFALYNMTRQNGIECKDNNCQITLNYVDLILADDFLFEKGSIYVYYDSIIMPISPSLDTIFTFSYATTQPCLIDSDATLAIWSGTRFSTGRQDSSITDTTLQPIIFSDPQTSKVILNGGTLHITSSGMIMTSGTLDVEEASSMEIENSCYPFGLTIGDGTAEDDFKIEIDAGVNLNIKTGTLFYNNYENNRIEFESAESSLRIGSTKGLTTKKDLTLNNGTLIFPDGESFGVDNGAMLIKNTMTLKHEVPYSVQKVTSHGYDSYYTLNDGDSFFALEGSTGKSIYVNSGNTTIGGNGGFTGTVTLKNHTTSIQSMLSSPFFNDIILNGGTVTAYEDVRFTSDKKLTGSGKIQLMGTMLKFGPSTETNMTNTIYWQGTTKGGIELNAQKTSLSGTWTFDGNFVLNGNSNILDLSNHGMLTIRPNSTLSLENISLKGLGQNFGNINFMDDTATLRLSNAYLELDNDLSTTIGGILVNGPSIIGLKNYNWTLDQNASLTVDGTTLLQDPLDKINHGKITFGTGSIDKYLSLVSSGTIKTVSNLDILSTETIDLQTQIKNNSNAIIKLSEASGELTINNSNAIKYLADHFITLGDAKFYTINDLTESKIIDGHGKLSGSINLSGNTLTINKDLNLGNQTTINSSGNFDLQNNAIILDGNLTIPSDSIIKITSSGIIDGQDNMLKISANAKLIIDDNVTLTLKNINLFGQAYPQIEMRSNSSALTLQNTTLNFDQDFTLSQGKLFIQDEVCFTGTNKFSYASTSTAYIASHSTLYFDTNTTFSYSPRLTSRHSLSEKNLIHMTDRTSSIFFNECSLQLPDSGWQITNGTILFNNKIQISGQSNIEQSFEFGNGISINDPDIQLLSGANIENHGYMYANFGN